MTHCSPIAETHPNSERMDGSRPLRMRSLADMRGEKRDHG